MPDGIAGLGVDNPHYLGPTIVADEDRAGPDRVLQPAADRERGRPVHAGGHHADGLGRDDEPASTPTPARRHRHRRDRNPMCTRVPEGRRHVLHGQPGDAAPARRDHAVDQDGTPHQWITPASESTPWPQGVSVENVPDMVGAATGRRADCSAATTGARPSTTPTSSSARLMFYHDHAWGITRLNVYAGEAAGYLLTDPTERSWSAPAGRSPASASASRSSSRTRRSSRMPHSWPRRIRPGTPPWGGDGQPLVPPRVHAGPEPRRPERHERVRALDVRPVVLAAGTRTIEPYTGPIDQTPYLRRLDLQSRRSGHLAVPGRPVLRAGADPGHAEHLGRDGAVQRHADRERDGVSDDHSRAEVVPLPDPERGQRPLLEPPVVRGRLDHEHGTRGGAEGRPKSRPLRPTRRLPDPGHGRARPGRAGSRSAPRAASCPLRWSCRTSRPPGSPTRPGSTSATSTSTRCSSPLPSGQT